MRTSLRRFAQAAAIVMLSACSTLAGLKAPDVSVADLSLAGGNIFEQRFRLTLRVSNPNDRDLVLDGLTFNLLVADQQVARGMSGASVTIPRLGEALVDVDGTAQTMSLLRQIAEMSEGRGKLDYRIRGDALTRDYGRIPFDRKGEMNLPWRGSKPPSEKI